MTAVEWLIDKITFSDMSVTDAIEQAKEMEKEQIENAWENGIENCGEFNNPTIASGKQYYNETFKPE
jgi:hypothetical protein